MFIRTTVKEWKNKPLDDIRVTNKTTGDVFLFNANRVNGILVRATTKSSFMFTLDLHNPKEKASYVESEDTAANIRVRANLTWQDLFVSLPVHTNNDPTAATVTTLINCDSIAYVYKDAKYPATKSHVVYFEAGRMRDILVGYSINQIYALSDTGKLTTS